VKTEYNRIFSVKIDGLFANVDGENWSELEFGVGKVDLNFVRVGGSSVVCGGY